MKNPWIFCGIFCAAVVLLAAAAVLWYRRRMKDTFRRISESLDEAIAGRYLPVTYEESWFSAVRRKLNRVLDIAGNAVARNAKDRRAIQELVSDISHQTKTPLANILLYAQLLCEQEGTPGPGAPGQTDTPAGRKAGLSAEDASSGFLSGKRDDPAERMPGFCGRFDPPRMGGRGGKSRGEGCPPAV